MEMQDKYIAMPPVLNHPVQNLNEQAFEADIQLQGSALPLQDLLASLLNCDITDYRQMLVTWMMEYCGELHI